MLSAEDQRLRGVLALMIAEAGHAPSNEALAARAGLPAVEVEAGLRRGRCSRATGSRRFLESVTHRRPA